MPLTPKQISEMHQRKMIMNYLQKNCQNVTHVTNMLSPNISWNNHYIRCPVLYTLFGPLTKKFGDPWNKSVIIKQGLLFCKFFITQSINVSESSALKDIGQNFDLIFLKHWNLHNVTNLENNTIMSLFLIPLYIKGEL